MPVTCRVAIATVCALAMIPVASAQQSTPAAENGKLPSPAAKFQSAWPRTLLQSKPGDIPAEPSGDIPAEPSSGWSAQEIEAARARCGELLKGLDLVVIAHAPVREGSECGAPAPVQLVSIGSNPQISFSPPPLLTCEMVAALHRWLQRDVQPLARRHLGSPIVSVATMSSFSCRIAYGRARGRLSEHGRVNALDLGAFLTADGETALVLSDWGPITREIAARAVAAQVAADKKQAKPEASPEKEAKAPRRIRPTMASPTSGVTGESPTVIIGEPPSGIAASFGWTPPSRVGGPTPADSADSATLGGKAQFLHAVHRAACSIFATVLGPEANKAHKNHFHLDMAQRKSAPICE